MSYQEPPKYPGQKCPATNETAPLAPADATISINSIYEYLLRFSPEEALDSFHAMNKVLMRDDTWRQYDRAMEDKLIERRNAAKQSQFTFNNPQFHAAFNEITGNGTVNLNPNNNHNE